MPDPGVPRSPRTGALSVGGAYPRARSGGTVPVHGADGRLLGRVADAGAEDAAAAVAAARSALPGWAGTRPLGRGRTLLGVAEALDGHREALAVDVAAAEDVADADALVLVDRAVELLVRYAGWADKVPGAVHPGAGTVVGWRAPRPVGVVAVLAPARSSLLGLVDAVAPALCTGNTGVVVASEERPLPAVTVAEVLATTDLPPGVLNVLTGRVAELAPALAAASGVDVLETGDAPCDLRADLERAAAGPGTRMLAARPGAPEPVRLRAFVELTTVWHPAGA